MAEVHLELLRERLRLLAQHVHEPTEDERITRLFERISREEDPEDLRSALAQLGAQAILHEVRP